MKKLRTNKRIIGDRKKKKKGEIKQKNYRDSLSLTARNKTPLLIAKTLKFSPSRSMSPRMDWKTLTISKLLIN